MTNIFDNNEGKRFIDAGEYQFDPWPSSHYLIIKDMAYWIMFQDDIYQWMDSNLPMGRRHHENLVIGLPERTLVTSFLLKWG